MGVKMDLFGFKRKGEEIGQAAGEAAGHAAIDAIKGSGLIGQVVEQTTKLLQKRLVVISREGYESIVRSAFYKGWVSGQLYINDENMTEWQTKECDAFVKRCMRSYDRHVKKMQESGSKE